jgi:hypothetical protein
LEASAGWDKTLIIKQIKVPGVMKIEQKIAKSMAGFTIGKLH